MFRGKLGFPGCGPRVGGGEVRFQFVVNVTKRVQEIVVFGHRQEPGLAHLLDHF